MCSSCHPPKIAHYEGQRLILESATCSCRDCFPMFEAGGPRCPNCDHVLPIELTDRIEEPNPVWVDPETKHSVRRDEVLQT